MMTRTQITLDSELQKRARERAVQLGVSLAEYIRRLVASDLERTRSTIEPSQVFDLGDSGGSDVARDKDMMAGEAVSAWRQARPRKRR